jgi:hypothetical protein
MPDAPENRNAVLVGKIVNWPNLMESDDGPPRSGGHGPVIAALEGLCLLVQKPARSGDPEPPYMHVLVIDEPGLVFFDSEADHDKWYAAIMMNEGAPVVRLAGRSPPPKRK